MDGDPKKPAQPALPNYVVDPLESQTPDRLEEVAAYASELADWKRTQRKRTLEETRAAEAVDGEERDELEDRDISTDPEDYDAVPAAGAYITVKETKPGYRYYYWQWRDGDSWENEYIAPVDPK